MGWQDAPEVKPAGKQPAWMAAPEVGKPAAAAEQGGLLDWARKDLAAIPGRVGNLAAGAVRGAGSIGATLLAPVDIARDALAGKGLSLESNRARRADMTGALQELGADPNSIQFQAGKLGTEVAGTLGVGGAVANGVRAVAPGLPTVANAIASGGFITGAAPTTAGARAVDWATRVGGGALNAGATVGLVDPEQAPTAMKIGGALPVAARAAGAAGNAISSGMQGLSERLMQSAIKPTLKQLGSGDAKVAAQTLLERGLSPNQAGVNRLREIIEGVDDKITGAIGASPATVDAQNVLARLAATRSKFGNQVAPTADLAAIQGIADDFAAHPALAGGTSMPVQAAQDLKRGTYKVLDGKYGQMGSAETEAQKAIARGLKEEVAAAVPGVADLNSELGRLVSTLKVAERRALMELNKNPMGLAALAQNPMSWAMFMADRSAAFKAIAARMLNASSGGAGSSLEMLGQSAQNPVVRNAMTRALATSETAP